jgi:EmrB/QacA subfamily drug resistance transporter
MYRIIWYFYVYLNFVKSSGMQENTSSINKNILLAVTLTSNFFNPFMGSAVNIALPMIGSEFKMNAIAISWVAMSYLLSSAILMVPLGKLADIIGRRTIFLYGNIVFVGGTLLCALAFNGTILIAGRLIQGIGSAMTFSTAMALIISAFPPNIRGKIIGYNVSAVYIGLSAAPFLGGMLAQSLGWRSLFLMNAIAGIFIIIAFSLKIKHEWVDASHEKFDFIGSILYGISVCALMYGISKLPDILAIVLTISGLVGLFVFISYEMKLKFPVLDIHLFLDNKVFAFSNMAALFNYAATFGVTFVLSLYLQYVKGLGPRDAGLFLITQPVCMALMASISGRLSDKFDSGKIASIGMSLVVIGIIFLIFLDDSTPIILIIPDLIILGLGIGLFSSPNTNAIMSSVEKKYLGVASATTSSMRLTGQLISMAISTLAIHLFIGKAVISRTNIQGFIQSIHLVFIVFAVLCFVGIFASLARNKRIS